MYPVNEIFETIQGEGSYTGTPAIFIRLQGCPVGCSWCDTKHTWELDPANVILLTQTSRKTQDSDSYGNATAEDRLALRLDPALVHVMPLHQRPPGLSPD